VKGNTQVLGAQTLTKVITVTQESICATTLKVKLAPLGPSILIDHDSS
jgi:hypothetical protein